MNKIIIASVKDYTIDLDGKPYTVSGQKVVGCWKRSIFHGAIFGRNKSGYEHQGEIRWSKSEFKSKVEEWHEVNL